MSKKQRKKNKAKKALRDFDKYYYYERSVQAPEVDVDFITQEFKKIRGHAPHVLREDFCGTGILLCQWVEQHKKNLGIGLDLDDAPIEYCKKWHLPKLTEEQQNRIHFHKRNVLEGQDVHADVVVAFNFSYFIFKKRRDLVLYFSEVRKSMNRDGIFILDLFGGPESQTLCEDKTKHRGFDYFWECQKFNPINHEAYFAIHFKRQGEGKRHNVFTYDWRLWTLPELREILRDAGFKFTKVLWEEDGPNGSGNGVYYETEWANNDLAWVAYLLAWC